MPTTPTAGNDVFAIDAAAQAVLFRDARTPNNFSDEPVSDAEIEAIYDLVKWAPTSANTNPLRAVIVRSPEAKARLVPLMFDMNQPKVASAPAVAILAADVDFHEQIPRLLPFRPEMKDHFVGDPAMREDFARFNTAIQIGYFILGVRAVGLGAGPMAGFDNAGVDAEFLAGTTLKSQLVVNVGHPGADPWFDRLPRLDFEDVVTVV